MAELVELLVMIIALGPALPGLALDWAVANPVQVLGTLTGVGGALLLAMNSRYSSWAWPIWIVSNLAWIWYALHLPQAAYGLMAQQIVFGVINTVGMWTWMFRRPQAPGVVMAAAVLADS